MSELPTDFNDLHVLAGLEEVKRQLSLESVPATKEMNIAHLAALTPIEYEQVRKEEAKRLNIRTPVLDKEVKRNQQQAQPKAQQNVIFPPVEIWPEPVDTSSLLNEIVTVIQRFIICEPETAIAATLWCAFTWIIDKVEVAPLAVITAPEMRCGKSQLLNLIGRLSYRPLVASNISPAAMFRVIESHRPTLLVDEADSFFKENEELRGIVNSGHTRQSAYVIRTVGDDHEPKQFSTWGAKAISGIGGLHETVRDRAIIMELRRKLPSESVERLRHADKRLFDRLSSQLARFADDAGAIIKGSKPLLPDALNDRAQDNWEPLLAIADYAGGVWPAVARETALKISGTQQEPVSLSAELLADIQEVFDTKGAAKLSTADLLQALTNDDSKPWLTYNRGKPISASQLAKRLKEYRISSKNIRVDYEVKKGFERSQFEDAFTRYLTIPNPPSTLPATPLLSHNLQGNPNLPAVAAPSIILPTEKTSATTKSPEYLGCSDVAAKTTDSEEERAAIMEYDGGLPRHDAEQYAMKH